MSKTTPREQFASMSAFLAHLETLPGKPRVHTLGLAWQGNATYEEAVHLATVGWFEGTRRAAELATKLANRIVADPNRMMLPSIGYDTFGAAFDPGAVIQGVPEAWGTIQPQVAKREVRIVINTVVSAGVSPQVIERRGIATCAVALALQAVGYAVTIDAGQNCSIRGNNEEVLVRVADAGTGSPLDIDRVVFALGHPAFSRVLCKYALDSEKGNAVGASRWDCSIPADFPQKRLDEMGVNIYTGSAHLYEVDRWADGGEKWVLEQYEKQTKEA